MAESIVLKSQMLPAQAPGQTVHITSRHHRRPEGLKWIDMLATKFMLQQQQSLTDVEHGEDSAHRMHIER